jgi:hypothetical protein
MKADPAIRLLNDLQQLIDRWELELGTKPLWWRKYSASGSGETVGSVTREATKEVKSSARVPGRTRHGAKPR